MSDGLCGDIGARTANGIRKGLGSCVLESIVQIVSGYCIGVSCLMIANIPALQILTDIIMWIATILTIVSLVDYIAKNKDVLKDVD